MYNIYIIHIWIIWMKKKIRIKYKLLTILIIIIGKHIQCESLYDWRNSKKKFYFNSWIIMKFWINKLFLKNIKYVYQLVE